MKAHKFVRNFGELRAQRGTSYFSYTPDSVDQRALELLE